MPKKPDFGHSKPTELTGLNKPVPSHQPNPKLNSRGASVGPIQVGSQIPADRGIFGVKSLPDFLGRIGDLSSAVLPTDLSSIDGSGPSEAVTRFMVGGVPSKIFRTAASKRFMETASAHPELIPAAEEFVRKYPRIAAHTRITPELIEGDKGLFTHATTQIGEPNLVPGMSSVGKPIDVSFSKMGLSRSPEQVKNTLFHEGTHVAQKLGNKSLPTLYSNNNFIGGYEWNPFEVSARRSGLRNALGSASSQTSKSISSLADPSSSEVFAESIPKGFNAVKASENMAKDQLAGTLPEFIKKQSNRFAEPSSKDFTAEKTLSILHNRKMPKVNPGQTITYSFGPNGNKFTELLNDSDINVTRDLIQHGSYHLHDVK